MSERLNQIVVGRRLRCVVVRRQQLQRKLLRIQSILGTSLGAPPLAFLCEELLVSPFRFLTVCSRSGGSDDSSLLNAVKRM